MIHLYTGNGKGKTCSATGLAIRALGQGMHVRFVQFMKDSSSGECNILRKMDHCELLCTPPMTRFTFEMSEDELRETREQFAAFCKDLELTEEARPCDMTIFDELATAVTTGLMDAQDALRLVQTASAYGEVAVTGYGGEWLVPYCDYISEIHAVRHPFEKGVGARRGIEY